MTGREYLSPWPTPWVPVKCEGNQGLIDCLLDPLRLHHQEVTLQQVLTLNFHIDPSIELPVTWLIISTLNSIWKQRGEGRVKLARTRAELEDNCRILREGRTAEISNSFAQVSEMVRLMFQPVGIAMMIPLGNP